ncbi:MAG: hypothetical protein WD648_02485 [Planctomycetaceae bacterium]
MRKLMVGFGLVLIVALASFAYVQSTALDRLQQRLSNIERRARQQQDVFEATARMAPMNMGKNQILVGSVAPSGAVTTKIGRPAATPNAPFDAEPRAERRPRVNGTATRDPFYFAENDPPKKASTAPSAPKKVTQREDGENAPAVEGQDAQKPRSYTYIDANTTQPGKTQAIQLRDQISENVKQIQALKARREMLLENPSHAGTLQAELAKLDQMTQARMSMHNKLVMQLQELRQKPITDSRPNESFGPEVVVQRGDDVRMATPVPADIGDRERALKESIRKAAKLLEAAKSLEDAGDSNTAAALTAHARAIQADIARQRAQLERQRTEIMQNKMKRDRDNLAQQPILGEAGPQEPWQQVLREIRELREEVKGLRQEIQGLRGASNDKNDKAAPPAAASHVRMLQETINKDGKELHIWRWVPIESSQPQPAISVDAPTLEPWDVPARAGEEKAAPPVLPQHVGPVKIEAPWTQPAEPIAPVSPSRLVEPGAPSQNPAAKFIRRFLGGAQPKPAPLPQAAVKIAPSDAEPVPAAAASPADESVNDGTSSTIELSPSPATKSSLAEPQSTGSIPEKSLPQPAGDGKPQLVLSITSDVDNSQPKGPTKYSVTVVKRTMADEAWKSVLDSSVYPIEQWESFFKGAAEVCRKTNVVPSEVSIEIRAGRETPQRHIQKLLKLAHDNGFRKTRIHPTKDEPKEKTAE